MSADELDEKLRAILKEHNVTPETCSEEPECPGWFDLVIEECAAEVRKELASLLNHDNQSNHPHVGWYVQNETIQNRLEALTKEVEDGR